MKTTLNKKNPLKALARSACALIAMSICSFSVLADNRNITEVGKNDACQTRSVALDLAHRDAVHNAYESCAALGDNWKFDKELFAGYEQCTPCGSSGEYKCKVTQAKFVCRTRKN